MSGAFTNLTGLSAPTNLPGFQGMLQTAIFRGVPFKVDSQRVRMGRRLAVHQYPYRDGGWPEDMGRALRTYSFTGRLVGDLAPALQLLLTTMAEKKDSGLLIHPTIGAVQVAVQSMATSVHKDRMRVIDIDFEFVEDSLLPFPIAIIAAGVSVLLACDFALTAANGDFRTKAAPVATLGPDVTGEGQAVVTAFGAEITAGGTDPSGIIGLATALPPPDDSTTFGRYGSGSSGLQLGASTTLASLEAFIANQRAATATAIGVAVATAGTYDQATDMTAALAAPSEAMRAGVLDPADQVRVFEGLAGFSYLDAETGQVGVGGAKAIMRDAMVAACRRVALVSLARAATAYQPISYDDAAAIRESVAAALFAEMAIAGDAFEDATYQALKQLRQVVILDLTKRGANLPSLITVTLKQSMPTLAIAQMYYKDAARADQVADQADVIHPAFCPTSFRMLAR